MEWVAGVRPADRGMARPPSCAGFLRWLRPHAPRCAALRPPRGSRCRRYQGPCTTGHGHPPVSGGAKCGLANRRTVMRWGCVA